MVTIPARYSLTRLHQIIADLETITADIESGQIMPTPADIESLFKYARRMKIQAEAAGFEFSTDGSSK